MLKRLWIPVFLFGVAIVSLFPLQAKGYVDFYEYTDDSKLYKSVKNGCLREMTKVIIQPQVAHAYCFCYADYLLKTYDEEDFDRMGQTGMTKKDEKLFKQARKACKPKK